MIHYLNNCGNRDYEKHYHDKSAFYDLYTEGRQAARGNDIREGDLCVVASSRPFAMVTFKWYKFSNIQIKNDEEGRSCRVFTGSFLKEEEMSKVDAANHKDFQRFFNKLGHFRQQSVC